MKIKNKRIWLSRLRRDVGGGALPISSVIEHLSDRPDDREFDLSDLL